MRQIKLIISSIFTTYRELILYAIIGGLSAGLDFGIYYLLTTFLSIYYLVANVISISFGISLSFFLNRKYNFQVTDYLIRRFIVFVSIGLVGMVISSLLLYFFIEVIYLETLVSKLLSIILVVILQFLMNKFITFKPSPIKTILR